VLRLARDERRVMVQLLASEGMSTRAIAPIVGAGRMTVQRDLESAPVPNGTPAPVAGLDGRAQVLTAEGMSTRAVGAILGVDNATVHRDLNASVASATVAPREVTGLDGKVRTYTPKPSAASWVYAVFGENRAL